MKSCLCFLCCLPVGISVGGCGYIVYGELWTFPWGNCGFICGGCGYICGGLWIYLWELWVYLWGIVGISVRDCYD